MNKQIKDFNELIISASDYLESQLHYSFRTAEMYMRCWKQVRNFMASEGIKCYNQNVGKQILLHKFKGRSVKELSHTERIFFNSIKMLTDFQETGQIKVPTLPRKERIIFKGPIGDIITDFLDKKIEKRLSRSSFHYYHRNLSKFLDYCNQKNINSIKDIDLTIILHFINELSHRKEIHATVMISVITTLRGFMKFVFEQKLLATDYSSKIPRYRSVIQPKLPSIYSKEEIEKLIKSVDRSNPKGKTKLCYYPTCSEVRSQSL